MEDWTQEIEDYCERWGFSLEFAIILLLAKRLGSITGKTTATQANLWVAEDVSTVSAMLAKATQLFGSKAVKAMYKAGEQADKKAAPFFAYRGMEQTKAKDSVTLKRVMDEAAKALGRDTAKLFDTSVLYIETYDGKWLDVRNAYRKTISDAVTAYRQGEASYTKLIDKVCDGFRNGASVIYRNSEGKHTRRELYSAVQMNFRDGVRAVSSQISQQNALQFGSDGVEISAHGLCAEDHLPYQGKRYSNKEFEQIQAGLSRPIGMGYNCRHTVDPIILGVGSAANSKELLAKYKSDSEKTCTVGEKEMTGYEFTQWQRRQESAYRKLKSQAEAVSLAGGNDSRLQEKASVIKARYNAESKRNGISTSPERLRIYRWTV